MCMCVIVYVYLYNLKKRFYEGIHEIGRISSNLKYTSVTKVLILYIYIYYINGLGQTIKNHIYTVKI